MLHVPRLRKELAFPLGAGLILPGWAEFVDRSDLFSGPLGDDPLMSKHSSRENSELSFFHLRR